MDPRPRRRASSRFRRAEPSEEQAEQAIHAFAAATDTDVRAAVLGYEQILGKRGRLVDGPARLAVVTDTAVVLAELESNATVAQYLIASLTSYLCDDDGRFLLRFQADDGAMALTALRPIADGNRGSARAAGYAFVLCAVELWESRSGSKFVNSWQSRLL